MRPGRSTTPPSPGSLAGCGLVRLRSPMVVYRRTMGNRVIVSMWWDLWKAVFEAAQLWWWRVSTFVLLPVIMILRYTHAVTGWPLTVLNLLWLATLVAVWIVALARYRRARGQQRSTFSR